MNILALIILFMIAFALQYLFTFLQMRGFTKAYRECRHDGYRAAIGKFSGKFHAGAIVMFGIDKEGRIMNGYKMEGVTVLARFKDYSVFNGHLITELSELTKTTKLSYSTNKAVLDAELNYNTIMKGEDVPVPPSPFKKAGTAIVKGTKHIKEALS